MFTLAFWKATLERVVATFAVALISAVGVGAGVLDVRQIQWGQAFGIAGGAALLTLLKCVAGGTGIFGPKGSPSFVADPAAAGQPDPAAAERADLEERLAPGHAYKIPKSGDAQRGQRIVDDSPSPVQDEPPPPPPSTRATGSLWPIQYRPDPAHAYKLPKPDGHAGGGYPGGGLTPPPPTRATGSPWTGSAPPD